MTSNPLVWLVGPAGPKVTQTWFAYSKNQCRACPVQSVSGRVVLAVTASDALTSPLRLYPSHSDFPKGNFGCFPTYFREALQFGRKPGRSYNHVSETGQVLYFCNPCLVSESSDRARHSGQCPQLSWLGTVDYKVDEVLKEEAFL